MLVTAMATFGMVLHINYKATPSNRGTRARATSLVVHISTMPLAHVDHTGMGSWQGLDILGAGGTTFNPSLTQVG
jgi:hypothetical protein